MPKLHFILVRMAPGSFSFQITNQGERLTSYVKSRQNKTFVASNGWRVMIHNHPEVDVANKIVYLRGKQAHKDERIHSVYKMDSKECDKTIKAVTRALTDAVEAAKNWKLDKELRFVNTIVIDPNAFYNPFHVLVGYPGITVINNRF